MTRSLPEWIGKSPDSAVPPRVRDRVLNRYDKRCQCGCNRPILAGEAWDCEDTVAIINGGSRRESNLKPWLREHHKTKTAIDVAEKSRVYRKRAKNNGIKLRKGRPMPGTRDSGIKRPFYGPPVDRRTGKPLSSRRTVERQT
jgi:5-methylcytosine-specific restriction protein A